MNIDVIERWNDRVAPDDEVYVLGDLAMGRVAETLPLIELLQGAKKPVPGNHDRCWAGHRNKKKNPVDKWSGEYAAVGFTIVEGPAELDMGGRRVVADHSLPAETARTRIATASSGPPTRAWGCCTDMSMRSCDRRAA